MPSGSWYPPDVPEATVTTAFPETPLAVAVMVSEPAASAVTSPVDETVAMPVPLLVHATLTGNPLPLASRGAAVNCHVCPGDMITELGLTDTDATAGLTTVAEAVPL
jgi:hypothetical protein